MELQRRSSGVAKGGLTTGIIGTALGGLNSLALMGTGVGLLSGAGRNNQPVVVVESGGGYGRNGHGYDGDFRDGSYCSEDRHVNRYELKLQQDNAAKDSEIALLKANTYNDQKSLELYKYVDDRFQEFERELARQAVVNQKTEDSFALVAKDVQCCCDKLQVQIDRERDERRCKDNTIINYVNGMFYPIQKADLTVGTTSTARVVYNPLCDCDCSNQ